jgi:nickel-dependent lactate racemase
MNHASEARLALGYGTERVWLDPTPLRVLDVVLPHPAEPPAPARALVEAALRAPIGAPPLAEAVRGARSAAILVSGKDRVARADAYLPPLVETLLEAGVPKPEIVVMMATGTHVRFTEADLLTIFGPDYDPGLRYVAHDCMDDGQLVTLGETSYGNAVRVNRQAYEADVRILTGRLTHHYFAGFTAGRKSVLPGVSAYAAILANHRMVVSGTDGQVVPPEVRNGNLAGNPVHLEMVEAAALFEPTFVVNTVLDTDHALTHVFAGDWRAAHLEGCRVVAGHFERQTGGQADLVVGSCGGDPYDCSFIQALKTLMNTHRCVADGGTYLLLAACPEGIKKGFLDWPADLSLPAIAEAVRANYNLSGHNTYLLRELLSRIRVVLVSTCPPEAVARMGFVPASTFEEGLRLALERVPGKPATYVIPYGNVTVVNEQPGALA